MISYSLGSYDAIAIVVCRFFFITEKLEVPFLVNIRFKFKQRFCVLVNGKS